MERSLIVDGGSNVGFYSLLSAAENATVLSIEPQSRCLCLLQSGAALSGLASSITLRHAALWFRSKERLKVRDI